MSRAELTQRVIRIAAAAAVPIPWEELGVLEAAGPCAARVLPRRGAGTAGTARRKGSERGKAPRPGWERGQKEQERGDRAGTLR